MSKFYFNAKTQLQNNSEFEDTLIGKDLIVNEKLQVDTDAQFNRVQCIAETLNLNGTIAFNGNPTAKYSYINLSYIIPAVDGTLTITQPNPTSAEGSEKVFVLQNKLISTNTVDIVFSNVRIDGNISQTTFRLKKIGQSISLHFHSGAWTIIGGTGAEIVA